VICCGHHLIMILHIYGTNLKLWVVVRQGLKSEQNHFQVELGLDEEIPSVIALEGGVTLVIVILEGAYHLGSGFSPMFFLVGPMILEVVP
jgi:hypothetical protein